MRRLGKLERPLLIIGLLLLGVYLGARLHSVVLSRLAADKFEAQQSRLREQGQRTPFNAESPDFSLWSEKRIKDYRDSLNAHFAPAIALLRIPKIHLQVPVLEGTDDLILNRGVGLIAGTARPGNEGNIGIAGHRDGFFRGLKDVGPGDRIELAEEGKTETFVIDNIEIVDPKDVSILARRERPSVTLVTCYPFYFIGSAPQRYIVQATLTNSDLRNLQANQEADSEFQRIVEHENKK
jgi:sortase A